MARKQAIIDGRVVRVLKSYSAALGEAGIDVTQMLLFGSHARGQAREWSDIDVAVVSPDFGQDLRAERVRLLKIALQASSSIEPHPFHPDDLQDRWSTLAAEVRRYGIPLD